MLAAQRYNARIRQGSRGDSDGVYRAPEIRRLSRLGTFLQCFFLARFWWPLYFSLPGVKKLVTHFSSTGTFVTIYISTATIKLLAIVSGGTGTNDTTLDNLCN